MAIPVEQVLYQRIDYEAPSLVARSPLFLDDWLIAARDLVFGFGNRPAGVRCPRAVFAHPLSKTHVAVVHVIDQEIDGKCGLAFLIYALPVRAYSSFLGDPFWVANRLAADFHARNEMPQLSLPETPIPPRSVAELRAVLLRRLPNARPNDNNEESTPTIENSESPALLGGAQILVDGGRVVFERPNADSGLIPALWLLLPNSTRSRLYPASFAFGNELGFDALVTPSVVGVSYAEYSDEEMAADYPEGRFEYDLQRAVEVSDQRDVDALLNRRSVTDTRKLAVVLLILFSVVALLSNVFRGTPRPLAPVEVENKAALAAGAISTRDPWTAIALMHIGQEKWKKTP